MMFNDAQQKVAQFLAPLSLDEFLDKTLQGAFRKVESRPGRAQLLGADPESVLRQAVHLAPRVTFHSANPSGPAPGLAGVADAADFAARIETFHARNYSVRFPELRPLSAPLDELARALEILLLQPVTASAFWSRSGMQAPVHFDDHDLIVVQLKGAKRWFLSKKPSQLNNPWKGIPGERQELGAYETVDMAPGDLLFLPRGTLHSVDSATESLHLALGLTPLTMRDALVAAVDHLADLDLGMRVTVGGRLAFQQRTGQIGPMNAAINDATTRLLNAVKTPGFVGSALERRASRIVGTFEAPPLRTLSTPLTLESVLRHTASGFCHLTATPDHIDFSYPGGHLHIHRGAQEALLYMVNTPRFTVGNIPGVGDEVRLSLATSLTEINFLTEA